MRIFCDPLEPRLLFSTLPALSIAASSSHPAREGGAIRSFIISRTGDTSAPLTYHLQVGGRATNGVDYGKIGSAATIPAGESSMLIKVRPVDDGKIESTESVTVTLLPNSAYTLGSPFASTIRIADNDLIALPTISVSAQGGSASESGRTRLFTITRSGNLSSPLVVSLAMGGKATNGVDYGKFGNTVTIPLNQASISLRVRPFDDNKVEPTESITLNIEPSPAYAIGTPSATTRIIDNDTAAALPTVSVRRVDDATEGGASGLFEISRTGGTAARLVVQLSVSGTATNGVDYGIVGNAVTIPAHSTSVPIRIVPVNDTLAEGTESVTLAIGPDAAHYTIATKSATLSILDNDTVSTPFPTKLTWTAKASAPIGRGEAETAVYGTRIYLFGGYTDYSATNSARCDYYDTATDTWHSVAAMPVGITHAGQATVGENVYLAGGYTGGPGGAQTFATTQVQVYNLAANTWSTIAALPEARGGGAMAAVGHVLHYFGGSDINRHDTTTHWAFDLDNPSAGWVARAQMLTPRNHMGAVTLNGHIYAVGGQQNQDQAESPQSALEVYDPNADKWSALAPLPFGRSHIASATLVVDNHIVTLGGETTYQSAINNITAYDPTTNTWTDLTPMPINHASGVAAYINGAFYFTTGDVTTGTYKGTPA